MRVYKVYDGNCINTIAESKQELINCISGLVDDGMEDIELNIEVIEITESEYEYFLEWDL